MANKNIKIIFLVLFALIKTQNVSAIKATFRDYVRNETSKPIAFRVHNLAPLCRKQHSTGDIKVGETVKVPRSMCDRWQRVGIEIVKGGNQAKGLGSKLANTAHIVKPASAAALIGLNRIFVIKENKNKPGYYAEVILTKDEKSIARDIAQKTQKTATSVTKKAQKTAASASQGVQDIGAAIAQKTQNTATSVAQGAQETAQKMGSAAQTVSNKVLDLFRDYVKNETSGPIAFKVHNAIPGCPLQYSKGEIEVGETEKVSRSMCNRWERVGIEIVKGGNQATGIKSKLANTAHIVKPASAAALIGFNRIFVIKNNPDKKGYYAEVILTDDAVSAAKKMQDTAISVSQGAQDTAASIAQKAQDLQNKAQEMLNAAQDSAASAAQEMRDTAQAMLDKAQEMRDAAQDTATSTAQEMLNTAQEMLDTAQTMLNAAASSVSQKVQNTAASVSQGAQDTAASIAQKAQDLQNKAQEMLNATQDTATSTAQEMRDTAQKMLDKAQEILDTTQDIATSAAQEKLNTAQEMLDKAQEILDKNKRTAGAIN